MILTITDNKKFLTIDSCTQGEYDQLTVSLTKKVNGWKFHPLVKKGLWDGQVSFIKGNKIPAGLWYEVMEICNEFKFECQITNLKSLFNLDLSKTEFNDWALNFFKLHKLNPRDYQIETAYKILRYNRCLAELATSAGKSLILFMVITYLLEVEKSKKILLIVPNISLVVQAAEDFEEYNNGSYSLKIQQIYSGKTLRPSSNLVIGTYQSLVKNDEEYFKQFDAVSIDECLEPNSKILMHDNTYKKIKDVEVGDLVKTTNDLNNAIEVREVEYVYKNLSKNSQMYEIELDNGNILKLTGNHKVKLTSGKYVRVDELTGNEEILSI